MQYASPTASCMYQPAHTASFDWQEGPPKAVRSAADGSAAGPVLQPPSVYAARVCTRLWLSGPAPPALLHCRWPLHARGMWAAEQMPMLLPKPKPTLRITAAAGLLLLLLLLLLPLHQLRWLLPMASPPARQGLLTPPVLL